MRDHQNIRRKGGAVCAGAADGDDERAGGSADRRIEKGARKTAERKIVGDKLGGTREDIPKIGSELPPRGFRNRHGNGGRGKKGKVQKGDKIFECKAVFGGSCPHQCLLFIRQSHNSFLSFAFPTYFSTLF